MKVCQPPSTENKEKEEKRERERDRERKGGKGGKGNFESEFSSGERTKGGVWWKRPQICATTARRNNKFRVLLDISPCDMQKPWVISAVRESTFPPPSTYTPKWTPNERTHPFPSPRNNLRVDSVHLPDFVIQETAALSDSLDFPSGRTRDEDARIPLHIYLVRDASYYENL